MKYRSKQEVDIYSVRELIYAAGHDWKALPEWLRDMYEEGQVFFGNDFITIDDCLGRQQGDWPDYLVTSRCDDDSWHMRYFCGREHVDFRYEAIDS